MQFSDDDIYGGKKEKGIAGLIKMPKLAERKEGSPRNARQAVLQEVLEKVNPDRVKSGYKPLTIPGVEARYTRGLSLFDLQWHVQECKKSDSFGKCFFGRLKIKAKQ